MAFTLSRDDFLLDLGRTTKVFIRRDFTRDPAPCLLTVLVPEKAVVLQLLQVPACILDRCQPYKTVLCTSTPSTLSQPPLFLSSWTAISHAHLVAGVSLDICVASAAAALPEGLSSHFA